MYRPRLMLTTAVSVRITECVCEPHPQPPRADAWARHCSHESVLAAGSKTVFVNGRPKGRVGDPVACGSLVATGSPNVFVGG